MTDTIEDVAVTPKQEPAEPGIDEQGVDELLVAQAGAKGVELVGPNGLLSQAHQAGAGDRARRPND